MPAEDRIDSTSSTGHRTVSRRRFINATGATGVALALAGCSDDGDGDGEGEGESTGTTTGSGSGGSTTVVFNNSLEGEQWEAYKQALYESGLSEDIELETTPLPEGNRQQTWEQWLSTGRAEPDLFMVEPSGRPFIQRDYLANLSDHMDPAKADVVQEEMPEGMVQMFSTGDGFYGVPFLLDIALVQYRKDLVEDAGFDTSNWQTDPLSWERFSEVIAQTVDEHDMTYGYGWPTQSNQLASAVFFEYVRSWGGAYFGDAPMDEQVGDRPVTVDEEPAVNALKMARSFIHGGDEDEHGLSGYQNITPEAVLQWNDDPPVNHVEGGDMVGMRNWTWSIATLGAEDSYGEDLGVTPIPYGVQPSEAAYEGAGGSNTVVSGWWIALNAHSENQDAAAQVLDAMVTDHAQIVLFEEMGYAPTKPALYDSEEVQSMPVIGRYADALGYAANNTGGMPQLNPVWDRESEMFDQAIMNSLRRQESPEDALSSLADQIEEFENSQA